MGLRSWLWPLCAGLLFIVADRTATADSGALPMADRVVVRKARHEMLVYSHGRVIRQFRISLGLQPQGAKERAGDFRTPEGTYRLESRNPRSDFFLSMKVSYPNDEDRGRARANGWKTGGSIMVHGLPNTLKAPAVYYLSQDWTDGCIALSNTDMLDFWLIVPDNTPIVIAP
jgi:murein L,D-transpeptidase YafK